VVVPLRDKTMPSVVIGLDRTLRLIGGCPTYALTEYVPGNIFGLLCPIRLCARGEVVPAITAVVGRVRPGRGT
jgi:hypothetical protein